MDKEKTEKKVLIEFLKSFYGKNIDRINFSEEIKRIKEALKPIYICESGSGTRNNVTYYTYLIYESDYPSYKVHFKNTYYSGYFSDIELMPFEVEPDKLKHWEFFNKRVRKEFLNAENKKNKQEEIEVEK